MEKIVFKKIFDKNGKKNAKEKHIQKIVVFQHEFCDGHLSRNFRLNYQILTHESLAAETMVFQRIIKSKREY